MAKYTIAFGLCLLASSLLLQEALADSWITEGVRADHAAEVRQLEAQLTKINDHLEAELPNETDIEKNLAEIEKLLDTPSWRDHFGGSKKKRAVDRLISLKNLAGDCNKHSEETFLTLNLAVHESYVPRIATIVGYYLADHIKVCGPIHKQNYHGLVASLDYDQQEDLKRVNAALNKLDLFDFRKSYEKPAFDMQDVQMKKMIMKHEFKISDYASRILTVLVNEIGQELIDSPDWESLKNPRVKDSQLKKVFDEYLFGPCKRLRASQKDVVEPALVFATFENENQLRFISGDEKFFHGMFNYAFCGKLLDERDQLDAMLYSNWRIFAPKWVKV